MDIEKKYNQNKILTVVALPIEISKKVWNSRTPMIYSGVGKINTVINLVEALRLYKPDLVLNLGTAGSLSLQNAGVVEVEVVIERDMDAFPLCDRGLIPFEDDDNKHYSGYDGVVCGSGDSFVRESDNFLASAGVDIVDMELIAIARVCKKFNVPWRSFKYISDYVGLNIEKQWQSNVEDASNALIRVFEKEFLY